MKRIMGKNEENWFLYSQEKRHILSSYEEALLQVLQNSPFIEHDKFLL